MDNCSANERKPRASLSQASGLALLLGGLALTGCGDDSPDVGGTTTTGSMGTTTGFAPGNTTGTTTGTSTGSTSATSTNGSTSGSNGTTSANSGTTNGTTSSSTTGSTSTTSGTMDGGVDEGGMDEGGTDEGGTDEGGTDEGGTDEGGTDEGGTGGGACCDDGDCLCHGDPPSGPTSDEGPFAYDSYTVSEGCIFYPTDAEPPFAGVTISDGFTGTGGCRSFMTGQWGPLYASWGIVAMIIDTGSGDQPGTRGRKLGEGVEALKRENQDSSSPLFEKMSDRYSTSGFSMGGGGTTHASSDDPSLKSSVALMAWNPVGSGITVPTLFTCGTSDPLAGCGSHGSRAYSSIPDSTPKARITFSSGHQGQPSAGGGGQGEVGLAFQKVFLEGDERWKDILLSFDFDESNLQ